VKIFTAQGQQNGRLGVNFRLLQEIKAKFGGWADIRYWVPFRETMVLSN